MWLSVSKSSSTEISSFAPISDKIFEDSSLPSFTLYIYIWGLVEHGQMQKTDLQKNQLQFKKTAGRM